MAAGNFDFVCEQGATFKHTITYKDSNDTAINLAGYSIRMDVRYAKTKNADAVIQLSASNSRATVLNASEGKIQLLISSVDTTSLQPGEYFYDLEIENSTTPPVVERILEGLFTVDGEVTG